MKLGIPRKLITHSDDPFKQLNSLINENEAINERFFSLYGNRKIVFDSADERILVINRISDLFNVYKQKYDECFNQIFMNRCDAILDKYKGYVTDYSQICIVHLNGTGDSLFICCDSSVDKEEIPHIFIPGEKNNCIIIPIKNFLDNLMKI